MKNNDLETIVPEILGLDPPKGWKPHNPVDFRDVPIEMPDTIDGEKVDKSSHHELTEEEIDKIIEETHAKWVLEKQEKDKLEEEKKAADELAAKAKEKVTEQQPAARKRSPQRLSVPSEAAEEGLRKRREVTKVGVVAEELSSNHSNHSSSSNKDGNHSKIKWVNLMAVVEVVAERSNKHSKEWDATRNNKCVNSNSNSNTSNSSSSSSSNSSNNNVPHLAIDILLLEVLHREEEEEDQ